MNNKKILFFILFNVLLLLMLSGCTISTNIKPVPIKISNLCIKNNPSVFMDGFLPELKSQIESKGITTRVMDDVMAKDCSYQLEYTANWRWDLAMYLTYAELKVYTNDNPRLSIGEAIYDARSGSGRFDKFGPTANKISPLVKSLFIY